MRALVLVVAVALAAASFAGGARAHHGFSGEYDFAKPVYVAGRVVTVRHGYPHAVVTIDIDAELALPSDLAPMRPVEQVEGRETLKRLAPIARRGRADILLDPIMTRQLADSRERLEPGDRTSAIAYERVSRDKDRGELRVMWLALKNGASLLGARRSYHVGK